MDSDGKRIQSGIVDELDSDTDRSAKHSRTTSRNISINSVASEDELGTGGGSRSYEISVNEFKKNIPFEDGVAEMKITRIVLEEQEVLTGEIPSGDDNVFEFKTKKPERDVQKEIEDKAKRLYAELSADDEKKPKNQTTAKGPLYDIEESNEGHDLSPEEARQQRIKEIRAKARRASLLNRGESTEVPDEGKSPNEEQFSSKTESYEKYESSERIGDDIKITKFRETSIETSEYPQNGKVHKEDDDDNIDGVPRDSYLENLLKHAQRQRSVLDEIIDQKERSITRSRETSRQRSVLEDEKKSESSEEGKRPYARLDSRENRPNFTMDLENVKVPEGQPVQLEIKLSSEPQPKLTWLHDGEEIRSDGYHIKIEQQPDGSASLSIDRVEPSDKGEYRVIATNEFGTASSNAELSVIEKREPREKRPTFIEYVDSIRATEGFPVTLQAKVTSHPPAQIQWFHDGDEIKSDEQHIKIGQKPDGTTYCVIDKVELNDRGDYKVVATNELGKAFSSGYMSVSPQSGRREPKKEKPAFISELHTTHVKEGSPVELQVKAVGYPQPEIKWLHDGEEVRTDHKNIKITENPDGSSSLFIEKAVPKDSGDYVVIAANDSGTSTTKARVSVSPEGSEDESKEKKPQFTVSLKDQKVEQGSPVQLQVKIAGQPQPTLKWFHDGEIIHDDENFSLTQKPDGTTILAIDKAVPAAEGTYKVVATNEIGTASSAAELTIYQQPTIEQALKDCEVVEGCETTFEVKIISSPEADIEWYHDGQLIKPDGYYVKVKSQLEGPATLTITQANISDSGEYRVVASNEYGTATSDALLSVKSKKDESKRGGEKPSFVNELRDTEVNEGEPLELKVTFVFIY